jgi:hypothetical protein
MYALITLEPSSAEGVRVNLSISDSPVEGNRAIVILSPGKLVKIRIDFELVGSESFDQTFQMIVYTNEQVKPNDLQEFGGTLPFPITSPTDFQGKEVSHIYQIRVSKTKCGNFVCERGENCENCSQDCGICPPSGSDISQCQALCKVPICIPIFCIPKIGCTIMCFPPPGWAICPQCCLLCLFVFGDPGPEIPEEIPPELADIMQSPECNLCSESLKSEGGSAFGKPECKLCIEKVVQRGASLSYQCDMCLMNIRDYSEQGADSSWCAICKDQWEAMYEAYKDAIQETIP